MVPQEKKICPRLPLEIGTIDLYSMGEKVCLETVSSGQVDFKRHARGFSILQISFSATFSGESIVG